MKKGLPPIYYLFCLFLAGIIIGNFSFLPEAKKDPAIATALPVNNEESKETAFTVVSPPASGTQSVQGDTDTAIPVSAENVAGNILSQYVSPYTAKTAYDKVYLKNSTELEIDINSLLNAPLCFKIAESEEPQVLVMHTHTTESYMQSESSVYTTDFTSRSTDNSKNMVKIGDIVTQKLNSAGIITIHDTTKHDYPKYSGSYTRAAETICGYLKKYPSIKVVLDLHRDAVTRENADKVKLVTEIGGKKAAQVMIVMGSQSGGVTNFPNWQENLKLAVRLQKNIETDYPTLARPISLMSKNYNESLSNGSLLIEFGTDANTLSEAEYSANMVANALVKTLNECK